MQATDLLNVACDLLKSSRRPKQASLRRACSTTYYALFHTLCRSCANTMVSDKSTRRAWVQAYRCLNHGEARQKCITKKHMSQFPAAIQDFANLFVQMQEKRHRADYDPTGVYYKSAVQADIDAARAAMDAFSKCDKRHKQAFVIYVAVVGPRT